MSKKPTRENKHVIKRQVINIRTNNRAKVKDIQQRVLEAYKKQMAPLLDKIFSRIAPPDVHITLDKIVIDLGDISYSALEHDFSRHLERKLTEAVNEALKARGIKPRRTNIAPDEIMGAATKADILEEFIEEGRYPSWASEANAPIQEIMESMLDESPQVIVRMLQKHGKYESVQKRLVFQFSPETVDKILSVLYEKNAKEVLKQLDFIQKRLQRQYQAASPKKLAQLVQTAALSYYLNAVRGGRTFNYREREFNRAIIERVQEEYKTFVPDAADTVPERSRVRTGFGESYQDLDILEYFLQYGSIPTWADVDNKNALQDIFNQLASSRLVPLQRMIERNIDQTGFVQRLIYQFSDEQMMRLLEPITTDTVEFVEQTIKALQIFTRVRTRTNRSLSTTKIRESVLTSALEYVFQRKRSNFVKQTLFQEILEDLAPALGSTEEALLIEIQLATADKDEPTAIGSEVSNVLATINKKTQTAQERTQRQLDDMLEQAATIEERLAEITIALEEEGLSEIAIEQLKRERASLRRQLTMLGKRRQIVESTPTFTDEAEQLILELRAIENQLDAISDASEKGRATRAVQAIETRIESRLPALLRDIEQTLALPSSTERTLQLQRHNRELKSILQFWNDKKQRLEAMLQTLEQRIQKARKSNDKQPLRAQRDEIQQQLNALLSQLARLESTQRALQNTVAELTRIVMKEGENLEEAERTESTTSADSRSRMDYLVFFLEYGSVPWWGEVYKDIRIEAIFTELVEKEAFALRQTFGRIGRNPIVWERLVNQMNDEALQQAATKLYPNLAEVIETQANMLERIHQSQLVKVIKNVPIKEFKWSKIFETLLTSPTISTANFVRQIIKLTAADFSVAPSTLIEFMSNIADNAQAVKYRIIQNALPNLSQDAEIQEIESELVSAAMRQRLYEAGLVLTDLEQVSSIEQYLQSGTFTPEAKRAQRDTPAHIEEILLEQLDKNAGIIRGILVENIRQPQTQQILVKTFKTNTFWELVQVLFPSGMLIIQRYFDELSNALRDKTLSIEKFGLLEYIRNNWQKPFDIQVFLQQLIEYVANATNRKTVAVVNEWKRKLETLPQQQTSLLIYLMASEIQQLKPTENIPEVATQIKDLTEQYTQLTKQLHPALQRDAVESRGLPDDEIKLEALYGVLDELTGELRKVKQELANYTDDSPNLQVITLRTRQAQLEAQIHLLSRKEPVRLRSIRAQEQDIEQHIGQLEQELRTVRQAIEQAKRTDTPTQDISQPPSIPRSDEDVKNIPTSSPNYEAPSEEEPTLAEFDLMQPLADSLELSTDTVGVDSLDTDNTEDDATEWTRKQWTIIERKANIFAKITYLIDNELDTTPDLVESITRELRTIVARNETNNEGLDLASLETLVGELQTLPNSNALRPLVNIVLPLVEQYQAQQLSEEQANQPVRNLRQALQSFPHARQWLNQIETSQTKIQRQLAKEDLATLYADWAASQTIQSDLMQFISNDISLKTNALLLDYLVELDEVQTQIYRKIRREEERRRTQQLKTIQVSQQKLLKAVKQADTINDLMQIQQQLDEAESIEIEDLTTLFVQKNDKTLARMQQNVRRYFKRLRTRYIWQRARIIQRQQEQLEREIEQERQRKQALEQQRQAVLREVKTSQAATTETPTTPALQAETPKRKSRKKPLPPVKPMDEPLQVRNAGLVILSPYLIRFFDTLRLLENRQFINEEAQYKAVHLLQYLATKQTSTPENELVLNKIIVGLPVTAPVPLTVDISEAELKFSESLLQGAISNWARMKTMSPDALRTTFLIRNGNVKEEADRWKLAVEKGTFDILLRTITWGFTFVRYPWMEKPLFVEWNYM